MDIAKLFDTSPPAEPLTSLGAILRDWERRTAPGGGLDTRRDAVVAYCAEAAVWWIAVERAVLSRDANGKHHNHQSKVDLNARIEFGRQILRGSSNLAKTFDALYDEFERIRPKGIGPVTTYDVAVRCGAYLRLEPQSLYLHAGVRAGWLALVPSWTQRHVGRIPRTDWPAELRGMRADDLEDFLCTYRTIFLDLQR
jgi:hypothetical protein